MVGPSGITHHTTMTGNEMILTTFPTPDEFYKTYWNKKPFIVRGMIAPDVFDDLIDADTLAGLSLEDDIKSRIVTTSPQGNKWTCDHGPFADDHFTKLGKSHWSLLVQNVEQYHCDTAKLLNEFQFAPQWLMDDIMVSYSTVNGSVGPHVDSYHVFLVQGIGRRKWSVGHAPLAQSDYIEGQDLKVLSHGFDGETVEVTMGDVIYIPPHFAHEGITLENAMTFSVGFLGPQISDMLADFGHYIETNDLSQKRYSGQSLDEQSGGFAIPQTAQTTMQDDMIAVIQSDHFTQWMAAYFSRPTHDSMDDIDLIDVPLDRSDIQRLLKDGTIFTRPDHIKITITGTPTTGLYLAVFGVVIPTLPSQIDLINWLSHHSSLGLDDITLTDPVLDLIANLYNHSVLEVDD